MKRGDTKTKVNDPMSTPLTPTCVRRYVVKEGHWLGTNVYRKTCGKGEANHEDEAGRRLCGKCFAIWFRKRFKHHPSMEDWYHYHHGPGHSDYEVYVKKEHKYSDDHRSKMLIR